MQNKISPENLILLQNFIQEVETSNIDNDKELSKIILDVKPRLIVEFLEKNNYCLDDNYDDDGVMALEFSKENPNFDDDNFDDNIKECFLISLNINYLEFTSSLLEN